MMMLQIRRETATMPQSCVPVTTIMSDGSGHVVDDHQHMRQIFDI